MSVKAIADRSVFRAANWTQRLIPTRSTHPSIAGSISSSSRLFQTKHISSFTMMQSHDTDRDQIQNTTTTTTASTTDNATTADKDSVLLQYVILRKDLWTDMKWPLGSIVAQACHASTAALWMSQNESFTQTYCAPENLDHMHKVVLEIGNDKQLRDLSTKLTDAGILHKLWIEQPEDFPTCLATAPYPKSVVAPLVKKLKLCKGNV